jgi:hypothetical protein
MDPHPASHIVYPYTDPDRVANAVSLYAGSGLRNGEVAIVIATEANRKGIERRLRDDGFDVDRLLAERQLVMLDAEKTLSSFMVDGTPDADLFRTIVDGIIVRARLGVAGKVRKLRLFGEMVNVLWKGNPQAALRLEELWNEVIDRQRIPLLCAYSLQDQPFGQLSPECASTHTHTLSA